MARARSYSTPGTYRSGVWLVTNGKTAGLVPHQQLPPQDGSWQYYWLGNSYDQINNRIADAFSSLNLQPFAVNNNWDQNSAVRAALSGQPATVPTGGGNFSVPLIPGLPGPGPGGLKKTVSQISSPFSGIASTITAVTDFLKLIAWMFHPRNLLRAVEFVVGIALMGFGIWAAVQARGEKREGFTTGESAISRSGLGRVSRELAAAAVTKGRSKSKSSGAKKTTRRRPRAAPHRTRRIARQRGMEAAARRPAT